MTGEETTRVRDRARRLMGWPDDVEIIRFEMVTSPRGVHRWVLTVDRRGVEVRVNLGTTQEFLGLTRAARAALLTARLPLPTPGRTSSRCGNSEVWRETVELLASFAEGMW